MDRDLRKPVYALAALFGLLLLLIFVFMEMGDPTQKLSFPAVLEPATSSVMVSAKTDAPPAYRKVSPPSGQPKPENNILQKDGLTDSARLKNDLSNGTCSFQDGLHVATAEFSNSETAYSSTCKLDVTVLNCQVIAIDIPKLGWLDTDHFKAANIDENGDASFEDDQGRSFYIHIHE